MQPTVLKRLPISDLKYQQEINNNKRNIAVSTQNVSSIICLSFKHLIYFTSALQIFVLSFFLDIGSTNSDYKQVAEMKTNLIEVERSLTDPINCTNHTVEFTRREIAWREAHSKLNFIHAWK